MDQEETFYVPPGQRQLFLDNDGIAQVENLTRMIHQPVKRGAVIKPDLPWEFALQTRSAPAWDPNEGVFKLWLMTSTTVPDIGRVTYAESRDGLHWTKRLLRQYVLNEGKENLVEPVDPNLTRPADSICHVLYDPDDPEPSRRYKGLGYCDGLEPLISVDGIHWQRLDVPPIPSQDESNLSYDPETRTFIATVKHRGPHGRSVFLSTSKDFEHWSRPELIFHADDMDQELGRAHVAARFADSRLQQPTYNIPASYNVDVYNMGVFRYESRYIGMPSMFHQTGKVSGDWPGFAGWEISQDMLEIFRRDGDWSGFHHVQLTCSRDLHRWERVGNRQPFLDLSPVGADIYDRACIIGPSFPIVRDDELWFYYTGLKQYGGPPPTGGGDWNNMGGICLAVLRRDGFISLDAGGEEGTVLTQPFRLTGSMLCVNVDAPDGELRAEVLEEEGKVLAASSRLKGDQPRREVHWQQGHIAGLKGQVVRLRFILHNACFYAYWLEE
jgi:hypothetical protein